MLSRPDRSTEQRLAKTFAALRHDLRQRGSIAQPDQAGHDLLERCERWIARQQFSVPGGMAPISDMQDEMFPELGKSQYEDLSNLVHGRLTQMLRGMVSVQEHWPDRELDSWIEVLIATSRGLAAAITVARLRDGMPEHLGDAWLLHRRYSDVLQFPQLLADPNE